MNEGLQDPPEIRAKDGHLVPHGTYTAYNRWKCRCVHCRAANARVSRERNERKAAQQGRKRRQQKKVPDHGTRSRYTSPVYRCRCDDCVQANRDYQAERQRLVRAGISLKPEWETW